MTVEEYTMTARKKTKKKLAKRKTPTQVLLGRVSHLEGAVAMLENNTGHTEGMVQTLQGHLQGTALLDPSTSLCERLNNMQSQICNVQSDSNKQVIDLTLTLDAIKRKSIENMATITEGLGGATWRTAEGHVRWLALLTTLHLKNIRDGEFGNYVTQAKAREELERRRIDREYRGGKRKACDSSQKTAREKREEARYSHLGISRERGRLALAMSRATVSSFDQGLRQLQDVDQVLINGDLIERTMVKNALAKLPLRARIALAWNILWNRQP